MDESEELVRNSWYVSTPHNAKNSYLTDLNTKQCDKIEALVSLQAKHDLQVKQEKKKQNTYVFKEILKCIRYLSKQNLPFRGHIENDDSENRGNFLELVNLLKDSYETLKQILSNFDNNCSWLSPKMQNEIINIYGILIKQKVIAELKHAIFFFN